MLSLVLAALLSTSSRTDTAQMQVGLTVVASEPIVESYRLIDTSSEKTRIEKVEPISTTEVKDPVIDIPPSEQS